MLFKQKSPAAIAWLLFAAFNIWSACIGDFPRLVVGLMLRPRWELIIPFLNIIIVIGIAQYAVGLRSARSTVFWRGFAPIMLVEMAYLLGSFGPAFAKILSVIGSSKLALLGVVIGVGLPIMMVVYGAIAVLRLGDYLGPTRRPLGQKPAQLSLSFS